MKYRIYRLTDSQGFTHYIRTRQDMREYKEDVIKAGIIENLGIAILGANVDTVVSIRETIWESEFICRNGKVYYVIPDSMQEVINNRSEYEITCIDRIHSLEPVGSSSVKKYGKYVQRDIPDDSNRYSIERVIYRRKFR